MPSHPSSRRWPSSLRALRHPNFRLYFAGQAVSTLGSWLQQVALAWLIYRLSGSAALLGVTTFASLLPQLLVGPLAGAWIDRHDKRRLLIGVQGLLGLQAITLAALTFSDLIGPSLIVTMAALLGILNAFDTPLRQSLLSQFVSGKEDLPNALALNAMLFNSSRFVGPPLAGLLLGLTSEAACFALNALSYLGLAAGLLVIRMAPTPRAAGSTGDVFREGLAYVAGKPAIRLMILSVLVVNLTASSYAVLLPVFAKDIFNGDARTLGWLWGRQAWAHCWAHCSSPIATHCTAWSRASWPAPWPEAPACSPSPSASSWPSLCWPWPCSASPSPTATSAPTSSCRAWPRSACGGAWSRSTPRHDSASTPSAGCWQAYLPNASALLPP